MTSTTADGALPARTDAPARSGEAARLLGPDFLRALAILLVMVWHLPRAAVPEWLAPVKPFGWIGVDLFFVLSGYLIGSQLLAPVARGEAPDLRAFYIRRATRILPPFLLVLALYALVPAARDQPEIPPVWRFLTFTMNFGLDIRVTGAFSHAWSLCVEEHFYLVLPALVLLLRRWRTPWPAVALVAGMLIGGMVLRGVIWQEAIGTRLAAGDSKGIFYEYLEALYYPTYTRLDGLLMGVLLAALIRFRPDLWNRIARPLPLLLAGLAVTWAALDLCAGRAELAGTPAPMPAMGLAASILAFPLLSLGFALLLAAGIAPGNGLDRRRLPGVAFLALISYSLYLVHKPVMQLDRLLFGAEALQGNAGVAIYWSTSIAAAALMWWAVERPALKLRDRWLS
ncbi:MAG TPA: acyltransferase [Azospirillaceae bacterium]|nr:acyltransferase [Azospirillaceae bacterium]